MASVYSDYWRCSACGWVLFSPTTGRADGVQCLNCCNKPVLVGERQPTTWLPHEWAQPPTGEAQPAPSVVAEDPSRPLQDLLQQPIEHLTALRDEMRFVVTSDELTYRGWVLTRSQIQCWADKADTVLADLKEAAAETGGRSVKAEDGGR